MGDNPVVELDIVVELPPNTPSDNTNIYRFPFIASLIDYFWPRTLGEVMPGPVLNFVIMGLLSFVAIKSQGDTGFPFQSHPHTSIVAVTSFIMYGIGYARSSSVYASVALLVMKLCLCTLNYGVEKSTNIKC